MGKLSNILTMAELLSTNRKYTVEELSRELEVTPRMVRFYKEELEKAGIYIDTIRGPYGGYVLNQSIRIPVRKFNKSDVELLEQINVKMNDSLRQELIILIDKVRGVYQGSKNENKELTLSKEALEKYNLFTRAIKEKRKVKIRYFSYNKGENERIIRPYDMLLYSNGWGVAAFCELKQDLRHFELQRTISCQLLDEKFE